MLKMFLRHYGCRNFSYSRMLRNAEKDVTKSSETQHHRPPGVSMDFIPSEKEKTILVLSGRFKSKAEIPDRITYETMNNAMSRFRIRASNILMVLALCLCGYYVWRGKTRAKRGETINTIYMDYERKLREDVQKEQSKQS